MEKMQSPLGGNNDNSNNGDRSIPDINKDTGDDRGLRKLTSRMEDRTIDRRLPDGRIDRRLGDDRLDSHLGEEREDLDNKTNDLTVPKKQKRGVKSDSILDDLKIFTPPTIRDYNTLMSFMHNHVVELRFIRRTTSKGRSLSNQRAGQSRRMLCTCNWKFLSSVFTRWVFNWNTPKTRRGVSWYKQRNLIIVWDLMSENFRIIPVGNIRFVSAYKCSSLMEKGRFILFYRKNIRKLTPTQEAKYFNS